ncbi:glycerol uptake facilitator protein [Lactococcus hodotermopsidis]|uniref:Glycerol uptake facilitator protein n=1 Tax=Pseudolactococcus hodotermopsidis TaxID=2709157 RepID=A0A6A0BCT7_9LACT|nr:MIP/aquaporin family protein [Lactococcus hodotermopsidis]GFH43202.1 glycerol uptake facilitator protein [Lactococcus hodotermopsidis]
MQEYLGEFFGTLVLIVLGTSASAGMTLKKAYGQGSGWLFVSFAWGMAVTFGVYTAAAFGADGHLNPAVTLSLGLFSTFAKGKMLGYIIAQLLGAFFGATLIILQFYPHFLATKTVEEGNSVGIFATAPAIDNKYFNFLSEFITTFIFIFIMVNMGDFISGLKPLVVGFLIFSIGTGLGTTTGYALNPARDFMPRLAYTILPVPHKSDANWSYAWIPVIAPIAGACLAVALNGVLH